MSVYRQDSGRFGKGTPRSTTRRTGGAARPALTLDQALARVAELEAQHRTALAAEAAVTALEQKAAEAEQRAEAAESAARGALETLAIERSILQQRIDALEDPAGLPLLAEELHPGRTALITSALQFVPADEIIGLSADEIRRAVVRKARPALRLDDKDAAVVEAAYGLVVGGAIDVAPVTPAPPRETDEQRRARQRKEHGEVHKQPLAFSKQPSEVIRG